MLFPCAVPAPLVTALDSTQLRVTWFAPPSGSIASYTVFQDLGQSAPRTIASQSTPSSVVLPSLTPFTNYTFYVRACTASECGTSLRTTQRTRAGGKMVGMLLDLLCLSVYFEWRKLMGSCTIQIFDLHECAQALHHGDSYQRSHSCLVERGSWSDSSLIN